MTTTAAEPRAAGQGRPRARSVQRYEDLCAGLAAVGLGVVAAIQLSTRPSGLPADASGWALELGRWSALVGTYGVLLVLVLAARIPWLERAIGLDTTLRWHRLLAPWAVGLVAAHVLLSVLGSGLADDTGWFAELWALVTGTRWILAALAGLLLMLTAALTSYRAARRRMRYETWWVTHLYTYLAVVLAFWHQISVGSAFVGRPWARWTWTAMTGAALGALVLFRWVVPLARAARHDLRVLAVVPEGPGTVSVWLTGRHLDAMGVQGGQFFCWRFLVPGLWWQAHPYSLSAPTDGTHLRITVRDLGDHSAALARLRPGTRVVAEGPYGTFTAQARAGDRVVLVAGGVGVTPVRAVLEELPPHVRVDVLYRVPRADALVLRGELDELARRRSRTRVHYLVGRRSDFPLDARSLLRLVPDVVDADVYVCGPESLVLRVRESAAVLGVPTERLHDEAFSFHSSDGGRS